MNPEKLLNKCWSEEQMGAIITDLSFVVNTHNLDIVLDTPDHIISFHLFNHLRNLKGFMSERESFQKGKPDNPPPIGEKEDNE